jgi:hypothetical protein
MKKGSILWAALCVSGFSMHAVAMDGESDNAAVEKQLASLQEQVQTLSAQVKTNSAEEDSIASMIRGPEGRYWPNVSIAPYIGVRTHFDGSELVVNNPYVNDDVKLLEMRQQERAIYSENNTEDPDVPHLIFSGLVEVNASYSDDWQGTSASDVDLSGAELDSFIEMSHWVSGYMTFLYDNSTNTSASQNRIDNSSLELNQGFILVGDLDQSPLYLSAGQEYMPFGKYSSFMISSPYTKAIGRVKTRAVVAGYRSQEQGMSPFAAAFAYRSAANVGDSNTRIEDGGVNLGLNFDKNGWSGAVGTSWISQIADSQGLQGNGDVAGFAQTDDTENLEHRVGGFDLNANVTHGDVTFITEFVQATSEFNEADMMYNDSGAKPKAVDAEVGYSFNAWRPSSLAVGYSKSWQSFGIDLPEEAYLMTYGVSIWKHTLASIELAYNEGYSEGTTGSIAGTTASDDQLGNSYFSATVQFDSYF